MQEDVGGNASDEASTFDVSHDEVGEQATHEPQDTPQVWGSTIERQTLRRYSSSEYILFTNRGEPECYDKACNCDHKSEWLKAMQRR